jgi:transcriptional regulator with GAF, ATPase, and Fis domain
MSLEQAHGGGWMQAFHPNDLPGALDKWKLTLSTGKAHEIEARLRRSDGVYHWFLFRNVPVYNENGQVVRWYGTCTDIEDLKQAEQDLARVNRTLQTLYECHQALVHANDERELMRSVCRIMVDTGGMRMAWTGYRQYDEAKSISVVAHAGHDDGYLAQMKITWEDTEEGKGPTGVAIRTGKPYWIKDSRTDADFVPWRAEAVRRDYISCISLPLISEGEVFGSLVLYAEEVNAFNERTLQQYAELASNLAFGIIALRTRRALEKAFDEIKALRDQLYNENLALREEIDQASMFEEIVGSSPNLQEVLSRIAKVGPSDSTVLITGETGTGKELVARAIHKHSLRASRPFVSINCAAIPPSLIASELFGHEKGAFTGALQRRLGRFELAEGGTIFLDEIGELPSETQVALLRVLQEREFERVGGTKAIHADVRVVAATNRDLQAAVGEGRFRMDLFYRLNVFPIAVPPLRDRKDDISMLVEYFIERYASKAGKKINTIEKKTLELFQSYQWPGNIRELQNVIERSVILCAGDIFSVDQSWLSREGSQRNQNTGLLVSELIDHEKEMIEVALAESKGRVAGPAGAAVKLGVPPSTLESKIKSLKIDKTRFKSM